MPIEANETNALSAVTKLNILLFLLDTLIPTEEIPLLVPGRGRVEFSSVTSS